MNCKSLQKQVDALFMKLKAAGSVNLDGKQDALRSQIAAANKKLADCKKGLKKPKSGMIKKIGTSKGGGDIYKGQATRHGPKLKKQTGGFLESPIPNLFED
tara:strand:+ start:158 stop:460 length:303 start_codon:yes stop_codon:yes gene_type:complete